MNINSSLNMNVLFSSLSSSKQTSNYSVNLADYASIKNGSYGKLMKAYYSSDQSSSSIIGNKYVDPKTMSKKLTQVHNDSKSLQDISNTLLEKGNKSIFTKKDGEYKKDEIYDNVSKFIDSYNSLVDSTSNIPSDRISSEGESLTRIAKASEKLLSSVGITIGSNNKLTINKETFMNSDMTTVKSLFNSTNSFGYQVSAKASQINYYAQREQNSLKNYNQFGGYSNSFSSGNLYNQYL